MTKQSQPTPSDLEDAEVERYFAEQKRPPNAAEMKRLDCIAEHLTSRDADDAEIVWRAMRTLEQQASALKAVEQLIDEPKALNTIDVRNDLQPFLNEWLQKANRESKLHGFAESYRYDSNDRWLLDHILIVVLAKIRTAIRDAKGKV
jgi:hypothetical protein